MKVNQRLKIENPECLVKYLIICLRNTNYKKIKADKISMYGILFWHYFLIPVNLANC